MDDRRVVLVSTHRARAMVDSVARPERTRYGRRSGATPGDAK